MKINYRRVKTRDYFIDEYGVLWVARRSRVESPETGTPLEPVSEGEDSPNPESPEAQEVPPEEWLFDDHSRTVTIGSKVLRLKGKLQYGLLKFAAKGGTDIQKAWETVWEYTSLVEWRTVRDVSLPVNDKLSECGIVWKLEVNTQRIQLYIPTKTTCESVEEKSTLNPHFSTLE